MLSSLSARIWLGSLTLIYLLFGYSLTASASTPSVNIHTASKPIVTGQASAAIQQAKAAASAKKKVKPVKVDPERKDQNQVSRSERLELIDHALSLKGVPYVFGGTSRKGFDCSGFTQYVFKGSGISLPRTSFEQCGIGSSVSRDQLQEGDLVFFHTYTAGASHVGIYIGGGRFIHASNSGVRVTNLADNYYEARYLGARHIS